MPIYYTLNPIKVKGKNDGEYERYDAGQYIELTKAQVSELDAILKKQSIELGVEKRVESYLRESTKEEMERVRKFKEQQERETQEQKKRDQEEAQKRVLKYLSKQKVRAFAKRFLTSETDKKRRARNVPIPLETAIECIERFTLAHQPIEELKPSFVDTRIKLLEICLQEKTPLERWIKVRDFLVVRLESQVLNAYLNQNTLPDEEVEPEHILRYLMNRGSFLSWCIKVVVLFSITDNDAILPDDVLIDVGSGIEYNFPSFSLTRSGFLLNAKTKNGFIINRRIQNSSENFALLWGTPTALNFTLTYSILVDQDSKTHIIEHDDFFDRFTKSYGEIVKQHKLDPSMKPSYWLSKLEDPINVYSGKERQQKFLKELTGKRITKRDWQAEHLTVIDISKVVKEFFPDVKEEIVSISGSLPIRWIPDNYLFDEDSLRYELIDLYLQKFEPYEREKLLVQFIEDFSIFNLNSFRELMAKWETNKEIGNIVWALERFKSHYNKHRKDPKERDKWLEYVRISAYIQRGYKPMLAYRIVSPNEKVNTIEQRYLRQRKEARKLNYNVEDPNHLKEIKKKWNLLEAGELVY